MDTIERYESFHDWYLLGVSADMDASSFELHLMFDHKRDRVRVCFDGATRCWVNDFLIQNIIYAMRVFSDFDSAEYKAARAKLDETYPWGKDWLPKPIAAVQSTLGAELFVEFETFRVEEE
ncbi:MULTISPECIES: hypothetical protein [Burkholderia]|uniref:hypothetical protein n=1 Tax=Burkholderia TaxID=32008 RepID=UPI00064F4DE8|nr:MULTISPECIES: hypothetical protein [Burkholderia]KML19703.1 hypothetical protein VL00_05650 [Burkholderia cepacia]KMN59544.1 hypothetical protein VK92_15280 [Burkholderia sp. LK4]